MSKEAIVNSEVVGRTNDVPLCLNEALIFKWEGGTSRNIPRFKVTTTVPTSVSQGGTMQPIAPLKCQDGSIVTLVNLECKAALMYM
jgi:hypothetical protein